jgi:hypothetical protein
MATNLARSSQGKHLYVQGKVPVSLSDLFDEIIDACLGNHGQLVNFGEAVWFSEIPPSREPTTSPFYCALRVSFLPRRRAQFIVYQCIAQTRQGLQKQTSLQNRSVYQRQNAGTKLKENTFSSLSYESQLGNTISPANTYPHYSRRNTGQYDPVGPKWLILYIELPYSIQF